MSPTGVRRRRDRCPGVLRPWPAEDGALVRIRVPGGQMSVAALDGLLGVAEEYGDARVHVTGRANLQLRALPGSGGALPEEVVAAIAATGLLPSRRHDLVRNVLASPQTGLAGGRADLRPVVADLDRLLLSSDLLGDLPGRFLFTLDDGRGDLADRHRDLGLVALGAGRAQLRIGAGWGPVVPLEESPGALRTLALAFLDARGTGPDAPWHVDELADPGWFRGSVAGRPRTSTTERPEPGAAVRSDALPYGEVPGGTHYAVPEGLDRTLLDTWSVDRLVVTPWHGVLIPSTVVEARGAPATSLETTEGSEPT